MKDIKQLIGNLSTKMVASNYPIAGPVDSNVIADLTHKAPPEEWDAHKISVYEDIQHLLVNRKDYSDMFKFMDGLEFNGLTLYNLVQSENGEPLWSNIYIRNIETRENDIYVDPNLAGEVLIGEDGMSVFVYSLTDDCFQIRDKVSTEYVIESHEKFSHFLSALIDTVS
ncbi:YrhA family protein [Pantoea dispersa]|uniref:YrhA family protein n=1 Tax=Pantoea dispersa TaxID=59814 RepID=UPI0039BEB9C4